MLNTNVNFLSVPDVKIKERYYDVLNKTYDWSVIDTIDIFRCAPKFRVVVFGLPGAFTPTCTTQQLPQFEAQYDKFSELGVKQIYCCSVNDSFVMNAWFESLGVKKVKALPDGNGEFTDSLGMLVNKHNLGFGKRSWRYAMVIHNNKIEMIFEEPGKIGNSQEDPYEISSPGVVLDWLKKNPLPTV